MALQLAVTFDARADRGESLQKFRLPKSQSDNLHSSKWQMLETKHQFHQMHELTEESGSPILVPFGTCISSKRN